MSESNIHIDLFTNSGCLTTEALKGYNDGALSNLEKDQVQGHLDTCELCSDAMEGLQLMTEPGKLDSIVAEINENLKDTLPDSGNSKSVKFNKQNRFYYIAAAASVAILMGFYFYLQNEFIDESEVRSISQAVDLDEKSIPPMPVARSQKNISKPEGNLQQNPKKEKPIQKEKPKKKIEKEKTIQVAEVEQSLDQDNEDEAIAYVQPLKAVRASEDIPRSLGSQGRVTNIEENIELEEYVVVDIASNQPLEYYIGGVIVYDHAYEQAESASFSTKTGVMSRKSVSSQKMNSAPQVVMSESKKEKDRNPSKDEISAQQNSFENEPELTDENHFFSLGNEVPQFPGGYEALIEFLKSNLNYPKDAKQRGLQGQVVISFIIEENGEVSSAKIIHGIGGGCDDEALRVIELMPSWQPAYKDGSPIRVLFNMPITFKLN